MKHNSKLNRSRWLLLTLFTLIVGISPAWGDELTVYDGTATNQYLPINGYYADTNGTASEFIIPSGDLTSIQGKVISQLTFYISTAASKKYGATFNVYLEEVAGENYDDSSASQLTSNKTLVYTGALDADGTTLVVPFDEEYTYNGGNLLIATEVTIKGAYADAYFYGTTTTYNAGRCNKSSTKRYTFIPKTTFTYSAANPYKKPESISVGEITTTTAVVSWTSGSGDDSETGWDLEYKTSASDTWTEVHSLSASPLNYTLTSLSANTSYDVRVRALYSGGESDWRSSTFKTEKVATPATGFTDNFETDKGWELINGTLTNKWVRGTATNNGGSNALYISNDGGTTNAYSNGSAAAMVYATKLFAFEAGDYTISYDWKANGESTYDYLRVALVPANVELTAGTTAPTNFSATGLPTGWVALDSGSKLNLQSSWQSKSVEISIAEAGNYQVVFAWCNDGSGGTNPPAAIDNFKILGAAPVLELGGDVTGTTLAFGSVAETTNKTITITNVGKVAMENITLTETADEDNVFAYAALPKTTLDPNKSMDVLATFSGSSAKDYTGTFRVAADDCDPIDVTVTATYSNSPATMTVTLNEEAVGASVAFGSVGKQVQKTFTVTNSGDQTLHITSIASNNTTDFTVSPATLEVAGHSSEEFTVTFVYPNENPVLDTEKAATITVTASNDGVVAKSFTVTGTRIEQWSEDFSGGTLPDGWEITNGTYWKIQDGVAKGSYSYGNFDLYTPSLVVEEGATLTFDYRMTSTYRSLDIQYSKDNGAWTNYATISYSGLTLNQWYTYNIENLTPGNYKFRFGDSNYDLDNFQGFKRNMNDPKLGIYSDEECTVAVATSVTNDFGFATTDRTVSYYIKNDGTGTMTLSKGDNPAGFTATLDKTSVAAGEHATLTITMPAADNVGYHSGNIVVTATDLGTFTVAANGVIRDEDKLYLDFSSANIPATWTANNWTKNNAGYIENSTYSSGSIETAILTAEAGEDVVIEAKMFTSSYTFGVNYKKQGDAEWSTLIEAANVGTEWTKLRATIAEAGKYQLQFVGTRAQIRRIYGLAELNEPVMVVYDDEVVAGSTYNFGNVSDEADATWTLTVKNEGKATLTGLAAALSGTNAAHYSVEVSATELAVNATTTITVKQLKDNIGAHSATLTISADDLDSKVIALSGTTRDHTKLYLDFEDGNFPATWTNAATNTWTINTQQGNKYLRQYRTSTSAILTSALTIADDEVLKFDAKSEYSDATLTVRYTTNGGITWTEYATYTYNNGLTGTFDTKTISGIPAGTVMLQFDGMDVGIDNVYGFAPTTAPVLSLTESAVAVASGSTKEFGNLTEAGTATYTLSNTGTANLVSTVATTGVATAAISGEGEGVTISENTVTLAPGKSATITLTLPYEAPYGEKSGAMTISSEGWVANMVVNYTATTIDPTALYVDFNEDAKPAGWYQEASGWVISTGRAHVYTGVAKALVTEQYAAEEGKNVLRFDAKKQSNYADGELKVYTSTDRNTWMLAKTVTLTEEDQAVALDALEDGNYYVKFESLNASIDNLTGLKRILPAPAHDLYVSASNIPTATKVPKSSITATATVYSLRADETGVYAKLFFDETEVATAEAQNISKDGSANFTLTGNVPATEKTYAAKVVVYYSDNSVAFETLTTDVEVAHTRTLSITSFTRNGEGEIDANASNQFSAAFNVTVQNTGSIAATPVVKIFIGETEVGTATADAEIAAGESKEIAVNVTNASAGEGGELAFTAKAFWTAEDPEAKATSASDVVITVNAAAPKFNLNYKDGAALANDDNVAYGLVKAATIKTFTITNSGTAPLELISIVAPEGYSATEVTEGNKNIAIDGSLDITVTLKAEQDKKSGNLVITYKVDENTENTFTLHLSGRSVAAGTWTEDFEGDEPLANWANPNGWIVYETGDNHVACLSGWDAKAITTPRLTATNGEELTFDVINVGNSLTYAIYSVNNSSWSEEQAVSETGEISFVAPEAGDYYLRLTGRNAYVDNFVGFKLATTVPVTISQYGYTTFASMSNINADELPDGIEVFYVKSVGGSYVHLTKAEGNIPAGTGLILKGTADEEYNLNIATGATTALEGNRMVGCLENTKLGVDASSYVLINNTDEGRAEFQSLAEYGITILAGKAYLKVAGAGARLMIFDDGETTGISSVLRQQARDGRVYNLNGQRVENPKKGQLYIINGKQTVVK